MSKSKISNLCNAAIELINVWRSAEPKQVSGIAASDFDRAIYKLENAVDEYNKIFEPPYPPDLGVRVSDGIGADDVVR